MDSRSSIGTALILVACGGPLRVAEGPVTSATATARRTTATWTCAVEADETRIAVGLRLANEGAEPIEWPDPTGSATVTIDADPCTIRIGSPADARPVAIPPGASSDLRASFVVVSADAPATTWTLAGPTLALPPGQKCPLVCSSVVWPAVDDVVPITAEPGALYVTTSRPRRVALELPAETEAR